MVKSAEKLPLPWKPREKNHFDIYILYLSCFMLKLYFKTSGIEKIYFDFENIQSHFNAEQHWSKFLISSHFKIWKIQTFKTVAYDFNIDTERERESLRLKSPESIKQRHDECLYQAQTE